MHAVQQFQAERYPAALQVAKQCRQDLANEVVHADGIALLLLLAEHRTDAGDDLTRAVPLGHHPLQRAAALSEVVCGSIEPTQTSIAVGDDSRQRLSEFMRDRC